MMRPTRLALAAALLFSSASSLAAPCNPVNRQTCGLPFPSDYWSVPDAASPTGQRLSVGNDILRTEVLDQLPAADGFTPAQIFNGDSGFSAASAVVFEFDGSISAATVFPQGDQRIKAWNLSRGEPVAIRAQRSAYAESDKVSAPSTVIEVFPLDRWQYGDRILVAVTNGVHVAGDSASVASLCQTHAPGSDEALYCSELSSALLSVGEQPDDIRTATLFTVRDREEVLGPVRQLVDTTWQRPHPVRNLKTTYDYLGGNIIARVTGELRLDSYRTNDGTGPVDFTAAPTERWTTFRLTLPKAARQGQVPVALYAHGLGINKESDLLVTGMNADLGIATFSIDFPNHGDRAEADGGGVFANLDIDRLGTQVGMMTQDTLDFASAHKALRSALADIDVVGQPSWTRWCWSCADGVADIDPTRMMMQGTSLGGVLGSTYASLGHDIDAVLFHVTGVGVTSILSDSVLWESAFSNLEPPAATGAEALLLRGAIQQSLDFGDGINFIDLMRNADVPRPPRPLMIITGRFDSIVTNDSSIAAARLAQLPQVGQRLYEMPGVLIDQSDYDSLGYGLRHYNPIATQFVFGELISDASSHMIFLRADAIADQKAWIQRFFLDAP